ncbi:hypothetical protein [Fodinibius sediminis]|uniref:Outer membrane protein beta-barrel domain-containing protein n=1 Tax=Fodinibius sediminis TaxID=1214077 RepID=A0A521D9A5_9BACT|nr:hypothetical protein [Fodinibius sediminis]SMO68296.1 hypothetical protein SAMN06265218_10929 [Fodinibius sediminis]
MMKKTLLTLLFCGTLLTLALPAYAQESSGRVGVGAILNDPTGLSAKVWISNELALDGALSFSAGENISQVYFHTDLLQHRPMDIENFQLYYGLGMRLLWTDAGDDFISGIRGPLGMVYSIEDSDLEAFFELAPTLDFSPYFRFFFAGGLGMRLYIN